MLRCTPLVRQFLIGSRSLSRQAIYHEELEQCLKSNSRLSAFIQDRLGKVDLSSITEEDEVKLRRNAFRRVMIGSIITTSLGAWTAFSCVGAPIAAVMAFVDAKLLDLSDEIFTSIGLFGLSGVAAAFGTGFSLRNTAHHFSNWRQLRQIRTRTDILISEGN